MNPLKNKKDLIVRATKLILIICGVAGIIVFNKYFDLEKLKQLHIEKEKRTGDMEVNQELYSYNSQTPIIQSIFTDYHYLSILPGLSKYFAWGVVQDLEVTSTVFDDGSIGYLLATPSDSKEVPAFIEARIKSGQYKQIFIKHGYRFIKIR